MKAINYFVVVRDLEEQEVEKVAGLEMTAKETENRVFRAEVITSGDKATYVKKGDIVQYDKFTGFYITHKGERYRVIKIDDIVIIE